MTQNTTLIQGNVIDGLDFVYDESVDFAFFRLNEATGAMTDFKAILVKLRRCLKPEGYLLIFASEAYWKQTVETMIAQEPVPQGDLQWLTFTYSLDIGSGVQMGILMGRGEYDTLIEERRYEHHTSKSVFDHLESGIEEQAVIEGFISGHTLVEHTVLECGMGEGVGLEAALAQDCHYIGIEPSGEDLMGVLESVLDKEGIEMIFNGQILRDVGGIEITQTSENPAFAITLGRTRHMTDEARLEAIRVAKSDLETQRFINAVDGANRYPSVTQIYIF
jgi:hypothetical protein